MDRAGCDRIAFPVRLSQMLSAARRPEAEAADPSPALRDGDRIAQDEGPVLAGVLGRLHLIVCSRL